MKEVLLSVIVPVYNTEQYVDRCIQSIISQTYTNLEIILVNDGSTDRSGEICDQCAKDDSRVKVIHQPNGGQNRARMAGLEMATGDFITFADSDDWLDADIYEKVFSDLDDKTCDLICCDHYKDTNHSSRKVVSTLEGGMYYREDIVCSIFSRMRWDFEKGCAGISSSLWNKFFKKNILKDAMKNIDYRMTIMEDAAIVYPYILRAQQVLITHLCGYHYFQHEESVMHNFTAQSFERIEFFEKYIFAETERLASEYDDITSEIKKQLDEQFMQVIMKVVDKIIFDVYHVNSGMLRWYPPYHKLPLNARIALYGAGDVGQSYYLKLYGDPNHTVTIWADRNYEGKTNVVAPECLQRTEYDIILLAVESENLSLQIRQQLLDMGIPGEAIVWDKPMPMRYLN